MSPRVSLSSRLALLFAGCAALVSLVAGILFSQSSEAHFLELDQQVLESRLQDLRDTLQGVASAGQLAARRPHLEQELARQSDLHLRILPGSGQPWFDSLPSLGPVSPLPGLQTLDSAGTAYRVLSAELAPGQPASPTLMLLMDITHHQHFLQRMQRLIWLTVGLSALATAVLGAWAARSGLRPLRQMGETTGQVSARSLTTRLPAEQMPAELAAMATAINGMLARLEDAFARLSGFSADIAHELRTPLSNLLTHTQVTLTRPRSLEEYREALHSNLEELQWMAQMVNDMLYLAKSDHGLLLPNRQPLNMADEVDSLVEYFAALAEDSGIEVSAQGSGSLEGDRQMLRRALSNLLDNALRFTPAGGQVSVRLEEGPGVLTLEVENTGEGIDPAKLSRLFDRFYRADPARREGSTVHAGLGLAITRSIVLAHGGRIRCESGQGRTRFVLDLPREG